MFIESPVRSITKTISWRVIATLSTAALVWAFSGEWELAITIGAFEALAKMALYFFHERAWNKIELGKKRVEPVVVWFTGLSGSGKSTLAERLHEKLKERAYPVELLDGDTIRRIFPSTGFSREERSLHIRRVGYLASRLETNGVFVIAALISPFEDSRTAVRDMCGRFLEVYISTPLEVCEERDVKGLYEKARKGQLKEFTGIDSPYETPCDPDLIIETTNRSVDECVDQILLALDKKSKPQKKTVSRAFKMRKSQALAE